MNTPSLLCGTSGGRTVGWRLCGVLPGFLAALLIGCNETSPPAPSGTTPTATAGTPGSSDAPATTPEPAKVDWDAAITAAMAKVTSRELETAQTSLAEVRTAADTLTEPQREQLAKAEAALTEMRQTVQAEQRAEHLTQAEQGIADGDLTRAAEALTALLALGPTVEQQARARELQTTIETHRQVGRKLKTGLDLLKSKENADIRAGQQILWEDMDVALPMLIEATRSEDTLLVANSLEMLRKVNQPERTLPAMVAVLGRTKQAGNWPDAIKQLHRMQQPGAGEPLLALALKAETPTQANAALQALASIVDPPPETLIQLLPRLHADGPDLIAALDAAYHAVAVHRQYDLMSRRGLDAELTEAQETQLAALPERLAALAAATEGPDAEAAWSARRLAVATRQMEPQPLPNLKILRATAELPDSPPAAVLDGVWNSVDPKTMWRHPPKAPTTIVFDLGEERTISGVRIWNANEQSGAHRGWKDLEIYVSNTSSPTTPAAVGLAPRAPGLPDTPDYGTTIAVPFARGRFVKLQFLSSWQNDGIAGLSEVQLLGY